MHLTENSLVSDAALPTSVAPTGVAIGDLNLDGKPDLVSHCYPGGSGATISVLRNTTTHGTISFAPRTDIPLDGTTPNSIHLVDLDGDGLLDMTLASDRKIFVFRNTSKTEQIQFADPFIIPIEVGATSLEAADLDMDGKPDLVFVLGNVVSSVKNASTKGNIQFEGIIDSLSVAGKITGRDLQVSDIDGDALPDIVIGRDLTDSLCVLRNLSTGGKFRFDATVQFFTGVGTWPSNLSVDDIDNDGLPDVSVVLRNDDRTVVYKNNSSPGNISLELFTGFSKLFQTSHIKGADFNGDGKIDLLANLPTFFAVTIFSNGSTPCNASFDLGVWFTSSGQKGIVVSDLNADGKPELIASVMSSNIITILRNQVGQSIPACLGGTASISSSRKGASYQWQQKAGSSFTNLTDNAQISGSHTPLLQLKNLTAALDSTLYRCVVDDDTSNVFSLVVNASLPTSVTITHCPQFLCSGVETSFTATGVNGGDNARYQWQDSTAGSGWSNIPNASAPTIRYPPVSGNKIRCIMTGSFSCADPLSDTSNVVLLQLTPGAASSIFISGNTVLSDLQSTQLSATPTNPGTVPLYQWQDSTSAEGWTGIPGAKALSLSYTPRKTGDKVRCVMTSSAPCAFPKISYSNALAFTVSTVTALEPEPAKRYNIILYPNPVQGSLYLGGLQLSDKWEHLQIITSDGRQVGRAYSLVGLTKTSINLSNLPSGIYVLLLIGKNEKKLYQKLSKQ